jgi:hypothetical protein
MMNCGFSLLMIQSSGSGFLAPWTLFVSFNRLRIKDPSRLTKAGAASTSGEAPLRIAAVVAVRFLGTDQ